MPRSFAITIEDFGSGIARSIPVSLLLASLVELTTPNISAMTIEREIETKIENSVKSFLTSS